MRFLPLASTVLAIFLPVTTWAQSTGLAQGVTREQMWPAPTEKDWGKPCLIVWQRSYEDALSVAKETGKAILVCINMDGEIASEHYAGIRYREPEIAKLYEPYVCVIASVYRHNPRDYDERGERLLCPRFGTVTCGEHIAIEPGLYERFMDGKRIAPRHIMVELDGKESYDVYYAWDTDSVFQTIREGIENRPEPTSIAIRGDRPIVERVASRDSQDRAAVEKTYLQADAQQRRKLIEAALAHPESAPVDLLRLALRGFDPDLAKTARRALVELRSENAADLINEALRVPMENAERESLIAALARLGESSPRARTLAVVHQGLGRYSSALDAQGWAKALTEDRPPAPAPDRSAIESRLAEQDRMISARSQDAASQLELAEASLALAADPKTSPKSAEILALDAQRAAREAEKLGASGWRVHAAMALAESRLGNVDAARARAEKAVQEMPPDAQGPGAVTVLGLFAEARWQAIRTAAISKKEWPPQWLSDVDTACSLIVRHPHGSDDRSAWHFDILQWLGATGKAQEALDRGLARFPDSPLLHDRLRRFLLQEKGPEGLAAEYEARLRKPDASSRLDWFAGYANLVAAEFHRRAKRHDEAIVSYDRGLAHYERSIEKNAEDRASADHYIAMAMAGRARIAFERKNWEIALTELLASFSRRPEAAASLDGLNLSAVDTAKMLLARLKTEGREDLTGKLESALSSLDPELLRLPAYETEVPAERPVPGGRRTPR